MSVSGPVPVATVDTQVSHSGSGPAGHSSLLAILKSNSKSTKRKLPSDDAALDSNPKGKANSSTDAPVAAAVGEPSTKKRKTNGGEAKGMMGKSKSEVKGPTQTQVKVKEKGKKTKDKGKGKDADMDVDMEVATVVVPKTSVEPKEKEKREREKKGKKLVFGPTGAGPSGGAQINGERVQLVEGNTPTQGEEKETEKKQKENKGKPKKNGNILEAGGAAELPGAGADGENDTSAKSKSKKTKAPKSKRADLEVPPAIIAVEDEDPIPARKLSAPTITWLASLDKELATAKERVNGNEKGPVASTSALPNPPPPPTTAKKAKTKKPPIQAPIKETSVAATSLIEEDTTIVGESYSFAASKKGKLKSKANSKGSKGKDNSLEQEQEQDMDMDVDMESEQVQGQVQEIDAHKRFAENLAGVISSACSSPLLSLLLNRLRRFIDLIES